MVNFDLVFHKDGSITLQTEDYCHHYSVKHAMVVAEDLYKLLRDHNTDGWDGDQPENRLDFAHHIMFSGGDDWVTAKGFAEGIKGNIDELPNCTMKECYTYFNSLLEQ